MMPGLVNIIAGGLTPQVWFVDSYATGDDSAGTYNFTSEFGALDSNRFVLLGVVSRCSSGVSPRATSVTIDGKAASLVSNSFPRDTGSATGMIQVWKADLRTSQNTAGNVSITFPGATQRISCGVYQLIHKDGNAYYTANNDNSGGYLVFANNVPVPSGGKGLVFGIEREAGTGTVSADADANVGVAVHYANTIEQFTAIVCGQFESSANVWVTDTGAGGASPEWSGIVVATYGP